MKKLIILTIFLFSFVGCSKNSDPLLKESSKQLNVSIKGEFHSTDAKAHFILGPKDNPSFVIYYDYHNKETRYYGSMTIKLMGHNMDTLVIVYRKPSLGYPYILFIVNETIGTFCDIRASNKLRCNKDELNAAKSMGKYYRGFLMNMTYLHNKQLKDKKRKEEAKKQKERDRKLQEKIKRRKDLFDGWKIKS